MPKNDHFKLMDSSLETNIVFDFLLYIYIYILDFKKIWRKRK